jgi:hypothetical protein
MHDQTSESFASAGEAGMGVRNIVISCNSSS